jgi:hypothetical protein
VTALGSPDTEANKKLIDRWFAPAGTTQRATLVSNLKAGFDKIVTSLNDNLVIFTDHPPDRGDPDKKFEEAYVYGSHRPRAIYIEQAFFKQFAVGVLQGGKQNWARVIVHECTHLDAQTEDHSYAWQGIRPNTTNLTRSQAAENADSWAFFAADCGGALVANDRTRALGGTNVDSNYDENGDPIEETFEWK